MHRLYLVLLVASTASAFSAGNNRMRYTHRATPTMSRSSSFRDNILTRINSICSALLPQSSRPSILLASLASVLIASSSPAAAAESAKDLSVYFGAGCFWHVQHEFVMAESSLLGRSPRELTSYAGYAGGNSVGTRGKVCYHNLLRDSEYSSLGHSEVVGLTVPAAAIESFAKEYFSLLDGNGDRPDKGDRGSEYRSLLGLPGGTGSPYMGEIQGAANSRGVRLVEGRGNDEDSLGRGIVYVMDSDKFPFHRAEVYHQFHDGFMPGEQYPQSYNAISELKQVSGELSPTGCPDI